MSYQIVWSNTAENELDKIFEFYCERAGSWVAKSIITNILAEPQRLLDNFEMCQIEELLVDKATIYRYLICNNHKIIYSVDSENRLIKIADVFDTRQNPIKLKRDK